MNEKEYISSGILELYVYGALSKSESAEVTRMLKKHPEMRAEVEEIEEALMKLSEAAAPSNREFLLAPLKEKISQRSRNIPVRNKRTNWSALLGWAASILLLVGLFLMFKNNSELKESLQALQAENAQIESEIAEARNDAAKSRELLSTLRDRNILKVPLEGQEIAPEAYATAYYDDEKDLTLIDAQNLPEPPRGMVYQVWSLKMSPLVPSSLGLLDDFEEDEDKIFVLDNPNISEGFGITLEPAGGSETPTMEMLYSLGTVTS
ncbi:anti-sigma factor [Autumnicola edwardsiae]|uniref:Anti-sigma factor n=1 Tax=Autumnicola edwardsiae TaxID=3075594 RepID=A0ABU3CSE4_9FLAO|nr:anti-sigma factor [Zunongwangia sp. F297]MDT0648835.1 anti-sigma factor [Zunongwangia sp. F297]